VAAFNPSQKLHKWAPPGALFAAANTLTGPLRSLRYLLFKKAFIQRLSEVTLETFASGSGRQA
ncbi:MAG: hypothetical protein ACKOKC_00115, partial [Chthoniobacterales bacterium]